MPTLTAPEYAAPTHTAGPWRADNLRSIYAGDELIADAYCDHLPSEDVANANAALIASAPDLLAAGRKMAAALARCDDLFSDIRGDFSDPRSECREGWAVIAEALAEWNAALAKAEAA